MNWREELYNYAKLKGTENSKEWLEVEIFIKQVIEKIIEEMPDWDESTREVQEQLRAKYLGEVAGVTETGEHVTPSQAVEKLRGLL